MSLMVSTMSGSGYTHFWLQCHAGISDIWLLLMLSECYKGAGSATGGSDQIPAEPCGENRAQTTNLPPYKLPVRCCSQELWVKKWWWHARSIMTGCCRQGEPARVSICHINARSEGCQISCNEDRRSAAASMWPALCCTSLHNVILQN